MFLAISRFIVKNDKQDQVADAFRSRPHLVDEIEGFIDMEVYRPKGEEKEFWLLTRWRDEESFNVWHKSDAHHESHKAMPAGLKLDPKATFIKHFEKISD